MALLGVVLVLGACEAETKSDECNALAEKVNAAQTQVQQVTATARVAPERWKQAATILDEVPQDIAGMNIQTDGLRELADEYGAVCRKLAATFRRVAEVKSTSSNMDQTITAIGKANSAAAEHKALIARLNGFCAVASSG